MAKFIPMDIATPMVLRKRRCEMRTNIYVPKATIATKVYEIRQFRRIDRISEISEIEI